MDIGLILLLLVSGAAAGLFGSILGLGGGILVVPILVLAADVPMHSAVASSLLCVIATSSGAAWKNIASGVANVRLGVSLEFWTVLGAVIGGLVAGYLTGSTLMILFSIAMVGIAIVMARGGKGEDHFLVPPSVAPANLLEAKVQSTFFDPGLGQTLHYQPRRLPLAMGISSFAGLLSGLFGIGGGLIKVPALVQLCGVPIKAAAATSNFMIGVTGAASAMIYYGRGEVAPLAAAATVLGVFAGSRAGASLAGRIGSHHTRRVFAIVLIVIAVQMFLKARGWWLS